ncbi:MULTISPECIES: GNAT family N-acetyltransferase [Paenibacillus]|uniref:GNAT family N-acetyltransferase n=1 Tax=Paenibacillus lignilyticus TaxID=1172615 RepID=A0ABS5CIK6_9BACL|nr:MULTISPECIES: GNAT family N-acetyltransferase [Paenibacillus]MBP3965717.1 GNAT family N-acetyltransferase [Paenibacillus lignilyticus]SFS48468.1 Acetyltransferase (GNAT) family protein [Paenibacillus sp. BC26]
MIRARQARIDDDEIIRLIKTELIPLSYTASPRDAQTIRELPKRLSDGVSLVYSRSKRSIPLGFIHYYTRGDMLLFDMLVVHPQHRGKQIGTLLISKAETAAKEKGCSYARLFVDHGNPKAQRLYSRLGYQTIRFIHQVRCYEMVKSLAT